jgi:hypothetical protein
MGATSSLGPQIIHNSNLGCQTVLQSANLLEGHTGSVAIRCLLSRLLECPSASSDRAIHESESIPVQPLHIPIYHLDFLAAPPDPEGWVRDPEGGLLYWVPHDCRAGLHSPALLTIPLISPVRSVSLQFDEFAFGTSWTEIFTLHSPNPSLFSTLCLWFVVLVTLWLL